MKPILPDSADERNGIPLADGLLHYFPNALLAVARVSKIGNDQHNPGEPMHWARDKSTDHANKILRHQIDAGTMDSDGTRHSAKVAWRALAQLEDELIAAGATPGRNAIGSPCQVRPPQKFKPYSATNLPQKGHRVLVIAEDGTPGSVRIGETGTVMEESIVPWIRMDQRTAYTSEVSPLGIKKGYANFTVWYNLERIA